MKKSKAKKPPPLYADYYRAILVDFPWRYLVRAPSKSPKSDRAVEKHYPTMTIADIKAMDLTRLADPAGCHWFFWVTWPMLEKIFEIVAEYNRGVRSNKKIRYSSSGFVWMKLKKKHGKNQYVLVSLADIEKELALGLGFTTRKNTEFCLLFRSGSPKRKSKKVREAVISPVREHSRKPDDVIKRIEEYCDGPYLEMFSQSNRKGWTSWGRDAGKYGEIE